MIEILDSFGRFRRALNLRAVHALKPLGLGTKQAGVLKFLSRRGECSPAELARHTITDPAATGRIVEALIRAGSVAREEHPSDRRRWVLRLTPKGRAQAAQVERAYGALARSLAERMDPEERRRLVETLERLTEALSHGAEPGRGPR